MRLNRFLARAGVTSRRAADDLIVAGRVAVNGSIITQLATTVDPEADSVEFDGRPVRLPAALTYIVLNKPRGYVVTLSDPQGRPTVADLLADAEAAVVPVGRLDVRTEGLLILTGAHSPAPGRSRPSRSSSPNMRFMFWTAVPAMPLPRLSMAKVTQARPSPCATFRST